MCLNCMHNMLVQEETKVKNQGNHSINYVNNQGTRKKHEKKRKGSLKVNESFFHIDKKESKGNKCHFYKKFGHFQKDYSKCKARFEKKDKLNAYICF